MVYRIRYIFQGTRDKGMEIADCYGKYSLYEIIQGGEVGDTEFEDLEFPAIPETVIQKKYDKINGSLISRARADRTHTDLKVRPESDQEDSDQNEMSGSEKKNNGIPPQDGMWVEKEFPQFDYDIDNGQYPIVGTELANFLNFDIDCFMNGGYHLAWKYDVEEERDDIIGWNKWEGYDLNKIWVRSTVSAYSVFGNEGDYELKDNIPFFIRMFGCKFINKAEWKYDSAEVKKIKDLQARLEVFCKKVFMPKDKDDKRSNLERFCQEIRPIEKKELRKYIPKGWITPSSLEQALAIECYAMIKGNVNFFQCENCGLYTVSGDNRARLCNRPYYYGKVYEDYKFWERWYLCKEDRYLATARNRGNKDIIKAVTQHELKRLHNHIEHHGKLQDFRNKLLVQFSKITMENEKAYREKINSGVTEETAIQTANEYLKLITDRLNDIIIQCMGENVKKEYLFTKRRYRSIKSLDIKGNIFE